MVFEKLFENWEVIVLGYISKQYLFKTEEFKSKTDLVFPFSHSNIAFLFPELVAQINYVIQSANTSAHIIAYVEHTHTHTHTPVCIYTHTCAYMHVYTCVCIYMHACVCIYTYVCMCICMCVYIYILLQIDWEELYKTFNLVRDSLISKPSFPTD